MQRLVVSLLGGWILCGGTDLLAQEKPDRYLFAEYYVCDQNRESFSDLLAEHVFGPIFDRQVEAGKLQGWGILSHNTGGEWRRLHYYSSRDLGSLLDSRDAIIEEIQSKNASADHEFVSICGDHDDYIWASVAGSAPLDETARKPGEASYSTYFECDVSRQERADEIVRELFAPALNQLVAKGQIHSWNWFAHVVGGKFRRLMTHAGTDHKKLIEAVDTYYEQAQETNPAMAEEFSQICGAHVDYLWDFQLSRPQ